MTWIAIAFIAGIAVGGLATHAVINWHTDCFINGGGR